MVKEGPARIAGNETKKVLRSLRENPAREEKPSGPYHDFWLLDEASYTYDDFWPLLGRKDAPVRIPDELLSRLALGLDFVPTVNAGGRDLPIQYGLSWYGPTVINWVGAKTWTQVMSGWAQILVAGPPMLRLTSPWYQMGEAAPHQDVMLVERDPFVEDLLLLAEWGKRSATSEYFIFHLGI